MDYTKDKWLLAIKVAQSYDPALVLLSPENESPTFQYGAWVGAVEHGRKLRTIVLRHRDNERVVMQSKWVKCPASDLKKKWYFRVNGCAPEAIKDLLAQLNAAV